MKLPDSCVCHVLSFLDDDDLQVTKRVSRRFLDLSNSMRTVVDLRETRRDVFMRNLVIGKTGSLTVGLRRFPCGRGAPRCYQPITGFPARYVSSVFMAGASDDIYKCDVGYMTRLEVQPLYYNRLAIPDLERILRNCLHLRTLILPRVEMPPACADALEGMTRLVRLHLSDSKFGEGARVRFPPSLTDLDASYCRFASHNIRDLNKLKTLNATDMGLTDDDVGAIMGLTNLETLNVSWNDSWSGPGGTVRDISRLAKLRNLSACMMTNLHGYYRISGVASLQNLAFLELENCNLWSPDVEWMAAGTHIENLNLSYNHIDSAGVAHICRASSYRVLDLSYNNVDDIGARVIAGQTLLERLDLQHNIVTSDGARELAGMALRSLVLERNLISESEAEAILETSAVPDLCLGRQRKN